MGGQLPITPPASVIASWPAPNYLNPDAATWMPAYAVSIHVFGTLLVGVRFAHRALSSTSGGLGLDDAFLLLAWMLSTVFIGLAVYAATIGLIGRHIWDVVMSENQATMVAYAKNNWLGEIVFLVGTCFLKLSVLLFHRRVQTTVYVRKWMLAIYIAIAFTIIFSLGIILVLIFTCWPIDAYWKGFDPTWPTDFKCAQTTFVGTLQGVLSVVSDLYSIVLPCLMIRELNMAQRAKIGLYIVFATGLSTAVAGCLRTWAFGTFREHYDMTWVSFWVYFWAILEYELGIICACAPYLKLFIKKAVQYARAKSSSKLSGRQGSPETKSEIELKDSSHNEVGTGSISGVSILDPVAFGHSPGRNSTSSKRRSKTAPESSLASIAYNTSNESLDREEQPVDIFAILGNGREATRSEV